MRKGILWMVMVMVCLSDGKVTTCSVETIITVSKLGKVSISCPSNMANSSELTYLLLFNDSCISRIHLSKTSGSVEGSLFSQYEVTANNSGVYNCKREVLYPPPYKEDCHSTKVIVAEKLKTNKTAPAASHGCPVKSPLIPEVVLWAGCGVLLVYSLSITCISAVLWRKLKRDEEDTNVYINTRPGEVRKHSKA